jgi:hypothetical protein
MVFKYLEKYLKEREWHFRGEERREVLEERGRGRIRSTFHGVSDKYSGCPYLVGLEIVREWGGGLNVVTHLIIV